MLDQIDPLLNNSVKNNACVLHIVFLTVPQVVLNSNFNHFIHDLSSVSIILGIIVSGYSC
jgi:hypothetical protein